MKATIEKQVETKLPAGYTIRGATLDDVEASLEMYNRWAQKVIGEDEINDVEAIRNEWRAPGFDPGEDIRLVFAPDGKLVGYIEVWLTAKPPVHPWIWGRVHPEFSDLGIGTWMLKWAENHARRALTEISPELRFAPRVGIYRQADDSKRLFEDLGYRYLRSSYRMTIDLAERPPAPVWPAGIQVRTYDPERDLEAVYRADTDCFRDHFGFVEEPYQEGLQRFKHFMTGYEGFDPSLWYLAVESAPQGYGEELAGICLCRPHAYDDPDLGYVNSLGVRRSWRNQGLGLAFLQHAFGEFYRRGVRKAGLGVDAENLTGALRLYEKAGMQVHMAFDTYERELRPGVEISVQSLED